MWTARTCYPCAMGVPAKRRATYADLLEVPDTKVAEIVDGELFVSPRPAAPHALASSGLGMDLGPPFQRGRGGPGGWWIVFEPELHLGEHVMVPDLAGWRRERMPEFPDTASFSLAPDWICEVHSDSTRRLDRMRKLPRYAEFEVAFAWLVDPRDRTLEVFRLEGARYSLIATHGEDEEVRAEPFQAVALELGHLWDRGAPAP